MTQIEKILQNIEKLAKNYNRTEYCECGCKGRPEHGKIGLYQYEDYMRKLDPKIVLEIVRLAKGTIAEKILLEDKS